MRAVYRPLSLLVSVIGGVLASAAFNKVWSSVGPTEEPPQSKNRDCSWKQIVPAAALHGAVFGSVKAAVDRGGLKGFERLTGVWAGD